ncbi:hypothetical protein ACFLQU_04180 [Verrucomicrobiota bacterium]
MSYRSLRRIVPVVAVAGCALLATADDVPLGGIGWRNDGSGVFTTPRCATGWGGFGGAMKQNVRWSVPLPNWGNIKHTELAV